MDFSTFFKDKVILVVGGTGSIGSEITSQLINYNPKTIRILSNSENELWETKIHFKGYHKKIRYLLGDIRDRERVKRAVQNVDYIFNAAAIKHVSLSEYNPLEAINVNIHGLENLIETAFHSNVKKLIHISTDKAVNPTTVMGATKMLGERLCISRELSKGNYSTIISCVRFGNVLGSRGSLLPLLKKQMNNSNIVTLTDEKMKRFLLSSSQAMELVLKAATLATGGEIFVLKMPIIKIKDFIEILINEYCPIIGKDPKSIEIKIIGAHYGEKLNEELISSVEFSSCYETEDMYIIYPSNIFGYDLNMTAHKKIGTKIDEPNEKFYSTKSNTVISKEELKNLLKNFNLI